MALVPCADAPASHADEAAAEVEWMGRVDTSDPAGPRFAWPGTAASVRFYGASLAVRLRDEGYNAFEVTIDGASRSVVRTSPTRELYPVAEGLEVREHELTFAKRTEALFGEVQLLGFVPASGGELRPASAWRPVRRVELVGDSITAGYGDEGATPTCPFSVSTENELAAYGAVAARELGAEHVTIAWSGKTIAGMAALYDRVLPGRPEVRWDAASWVPDARGRKPGDQRHAPGPTTEEEAFVVGLPMRSSRASAPRIRTRSSSARSGRCSPTGSPRAGVASPTRGRICRRSWIARAAGDERVALLEFPTQDTNKAGCGFHPGVATHRAMADQLAEFLRARLEW